MDYENMDHLQSAPALNEKTTTSEDQPQQTTDTDTCDCKEFFEKKCREMEETCCKFTNRLKADWEASDGNPYIKKIDVCRVEIYKSRDDEEPIDTFETKKEQGLTLRSLLALGAVSLVAICTLKRWLK